MSLLFKNARIATKLKECFFFNVTVDHVGNSIAWTPKNGAETIKAIEMLQNPKNVPEMCLLGF